MCRAAKQTFTTSEDLGHERGVMCQLDVGEIAFEIVANA
jgi:hypothetical protein